MVGFLILVIIIVVVALFYEKPKPPPPKTPNRLYSWAEREGYDMEFAHKYIDHLNELMKLDSMDLKDETALKEEINAVEYHKSQYKNCYEKSKKKDKFSKIDNDTFETDIGRYRLKKEYKGKPISDIYSDEDIEKGRDKEEKKKVYSDIEY
jgi:hypothetical protein